MGGGHVGQTQIANGNTSFNPTSLGGGSIMVGKNVGNGPVHQQGWASATGGGFSLGIGLMNLEDLDLMNLDEYDLMNLATQKGTSINEFEAKKGS